MDFEISPRIEDYRARIAAFVEREILPLEADRSSYDAHGNIALPLLDRRRCRSAHCETVRGLRGAMARARAR